METEPGKNFTRLIEDLEKNGSAYSVFYAIFICEKLSKKLNPERNDESFDQQGIRFRPYENYVYPPSNIRSIKFENNELILVLSFLGLYGINAPVPRCYHDQVAMQQNIYGEGEVPLQNFFDIFNNRFYWLYYQAWKKYRSYLGLSDNPDNKATQRIFSFIGQGPQFKKEKSQIPHFKLLRLSGVLSNRIRSKAGLIILLKEFFPHFDMKIEEFVPAMVKLSEIPKLGKKEIENAIQLGINSVAGQSVLDYMSRIRLVISSIEFEEYLEFLPGGNNIERLQQLLDIYLNDGLEFDIKFIVSIGNMKKFHWNDKRLKLGQSMWLGAPKQKKIEFNYPYEKFVKESEVNKYIV